VLCEGVVRIALGNVRDTRTASTKPLDREGLAEVLGAYKTVSVSEECAPRALGLEVEALAKRIGYSGSIETFALQDEFIHCHGTHADILAAHGLSVGVLITQILGAHNDDSKTPS
jgi:transketolase